MKKNATLVGLMLFAASFINATVRTVSNTPSTLAQFNTIQAAIDASANGDSVYVHGSPNVYAAFTLTNKQLTFIGPGWAPDKNIPLTAIVTGCTITGAACSGTEIHGMTFNGLITINAAKPDNLSFIRNHFINLSVAINQGSVTYANYLFEGNLFENSTANAAISSTYQNFLFQNNYFYENGTGSPGNIGGFFNSLNVLFNHNLWFGPSGSARSAFTSTCRSLNITNNIFVKRDAASENSGSTFSNNITFNAGNNTPWLSNGNIDGLGNVANTDPQMAAQASVNAGTHNALADYTIAAGPANNSGTDGKDMGLLYDVTGSLNFTNSRNSRLPRIFSMNVVSPSVAPGGNVTINVDARVSN